MNTLSDSTPSLRNLINQWYGLCGFCGKIVTDFGNHSLNLCFLLHAPTLLLWFLPLVQPNSRQWTTSMLVKPLAQGTLWKGAAWVHVRLLEPVMRSLGGGHQEDMTLSRTWAIKGSSSPPLFLGFMFHLPSPYQKLSQGQPWHSKEVVETIWTIYLTEPVKVST